MFDVITVTKIVASIAAVGVSLGTAIYNMCSNKTHEEDRPYISPFAKPCYTSYNRPTYPTYPMYTIDPNGPYTKEELNGVVPYNVQPRGPILETRRNLTYPMYPEMMPPQYPVCYNTPPIMSQYNPYYNYQPYNYDNMTTYCQPMTNNNANVRYPNNNFASLFEYNQGDPYSYNGYQSNNNRNAQQQPQQQFNNQNQYYQQSNANQFHEHNNQGPVMKTYTGCNLSDKDVTECMNNMMARKRHTNLSDDNQVNRSFTSTNDKKHNCRIVRQTSPVDANGVSAAFITDDGDALFGY